MLPSLRPRVWASCIACLALVALSAGIALAQQDEQQTSDQASSQGASQGQQENDEQERQRQEQQRRRQEQERQRNDRSDDDDEDRDNEQDRQRGQDRQRDEQGRQRDEQDRQRDDQSWQRDQQARQRGEQGRERSVQINRQDDSRFGAQGQRSRFPEPNRDGQFGSQQFGQDRQFSRDGQFSDEAQRSGRFGQQSGQYGQQQIGSGNRDAGLGVNIISEGGQGITVVRVFQGTPAQQMGIREGDRITEVNGQQVQSTQEFISQIRNMTPGDQVQLSIERNREQIMLSGELESRQEALARNQPGGTQWQQEDETWQTGYEQRDPNQQQGRIARGGDQDGRIQEIEQQVARISEQLDQLRASLRQLRQLRQEQGGQFTRGGERQAGYDEYQGGYQEQRIGTRQSDEQWDGQGIQRSGRIIEERRGPIIEERGGRIIDERGQRSGRIIDERGTRQIDSGQGSIQSDGIRGGISNRSDGSFRSDEGGSDSSGGVTGGLRTRPDNDPNWERR